MKLLLPLYPSNYDTQEAETLLQKVQGRNSNYEYSNAETHDGQISASPPFSPTSNRRPSSFQFVRNSVENRFKENQEHYDTFCYKGKTVDPFNASSLPITQSIHHFLTYFESLFFSQTVVQPKVSLSLHSAGKQVIKDCISDPLQMRCLLAAMAVRRETFDGHFIEGGSARYISDAVLALQRRLESSPVLDPKLIYAMMKLFEAEAYRSNVEGALIHLHGAQAAYRQVRVWANVDQSYTATLCGSEEAFLLKSIQFNPATFPTLADPGSALSAFSDDIIRVYVLGARPFDGTGQILRATLMNYHSAGNGVMGLHEIISDLIEYSSVRRNMLLHEQAGLQIPAIVSQWAHLRRFALVFRLMSVTILKDDFLHAIRVALVIWLSIVANYTGFDRNLQIVAMHLQNVMATLPPYEAIGTPETIAWILMLGASTGEAFTSRNWFISQLSEFSKKIDPGGERGIEQWYACLEASSQGCLYCEVVQRQSHVDIAAKILAERLK